GSCPTTTIILRFKDGTTAECDVLLGADGIKSAVRATLVSNLAREGKITKEEAARPNPVWSGTGAYRGLIPTARLEAGAPGHRALADDLLHLTTFPLNNGALINAVAFVSDPSKEGTQYSENSSEWGVAVANEELARQYAGWEPDVAALLEAHCSLYRQQTFWANGALMQCVDKPTRWAINVAQEMSTFVSGRVAVLGDAAHTMTPHHGSGVGQAIEDAYILAAHPKCTRSSLPRVLQIYDEVRRPKASTVWHRSRTSGLIYELGGAGCEHLGMHDDNVSSEMLAKRVGKAAEENYGTTAECDVLLGADGINSAVRATLVSYLAEEGKIIKEEAARPNPVWSGTVAYRGLIPKARPKPGHLGIYCGKNKHLTTFPLNKGALINAVAFCSDPSKDGTQYSENSNEWGVDVSNEELVRQHEGWEPECVDKPTRWAINVAQEKSTFVSGRVAVLGDAAHAMTLHQRSGAGQAIEVRGAHTLQDAYILAALLAHPKCTRSSLPRVLQIYDEVRRPKASTVWHRSRTSGLIYERSSAGCEHLGMHDDNVSSEMLAKRVGKAAEEN
ncbi:FAD/NAD(P)-binding domain-containing protein, partial [Athelia psychrophila]